MKSDKEIPEPSRLQFLDNDLANSFPSSDAEDNLFGTLNSGSIADLALMKTLLGIRRKSRQPSFREVIECFAL